MKKKSVVVFLSLIVMYVSTARAMNSLVDVACSMESSIDVTNIILKTVESRICQVEFDLITLDSKVDTIDKQSPLDKACTIESKVDILQGIVNISQSSVDITQQLVEIFESKVENINIPIQSLLDKLIVIDGQIDILDISVSILDSLVDFIDIIDSKVEIVLGDSASIESKVCAVDSKIDVADELTSSFAESLITIDSSVDLLISKIDQMYIQVVDLESNIEVASSRIDITEALTNTLEDKICDMDAKTKDIDNIINDTKTVINLSDTKASIAAVNFVETWTIIQAVQDKTCTVDSKSDMLSSLLDHVTVYVDQRGTATVIEALLEKACAADDIAILIQKTIGQLTTLSLAVSFTVQDVILDKLCLVESKVEELDTTFTVLNPLKNCLGTPIRQEDVGTTGYSITTPGRYYLAENITYSPAASSAAITIQSSNVYLALNGKTMEQGNDIADITGIRILGQRNNIAIVDGSIKFFTGDGIRVPETGDVGTNSVTNFLLNDLLLEDVGSGAGGAAEGSDGICISSSNNIFIFNSIMSRSTDEGFDLNDCSRIIISNCICEGSVTSAGCFIDGNCTDIWIRDSSFNGNFGSGIVFSQINNTNQVRMVIERCAVLNNGDDGIATSIGDNQNGTLTDTYIKDCSIVGNNSNGVHITVPNFNRCVIRDNIISDNKNHGIFLDSTFSTVGSALDNNVILFNTITNNAGDNIHEDTVDVGNSIMGNFAYHPGGDSRNYSLATTSLTGIKSVLSQTGAFPTTLPTYWFNVSMTP